MSVHRVSAQSDCARLGATKRLGNPLPLIEVQSVTITHILRPDFHGSHLAHLRCYLVIYRRLESSDFPFLDALNTLVLDWHRPVLDHMRAQPTNKLMHQYQR